MDAISAFCQWLIRKDASELSKMYSSFFAFRVALNVENTPPALSTPYSEITVSGELSKNIDTRSAFFNPALIRP